MSGLSFLLVALFLPLFPFSMVFNSLFARVESIGLRMLLLVAWPAAGIGLLSALDRAPPDWLVHWSLATALLYGFRLLALRDLPLWLGHFATSSWALLWLPAVFGYPATWWLMMLAAFSLPLALLAWLSGHLERVFGAAYAGSLDGLGTSLPRLAGLLVLLVLAAIGTPLFPGFFVLLDMLNGLLPGMPLTALGLLALWLLWAWAGMRILQGLIVGQADGRTHADIGPVQAGVLGATVAIFALSGLWFSESLV